MLMSAAMLHTARIVRRGKRNPETVSLRLDVPVEIAEISRQDMPEVLRMNDTPDGKAAFHGHDGMLFTPMRHKQSRMGRVPDLVQLLSNPDVEVMGLESPFSKGRFWQAEFLPSHNPGQVAQMPRFGDLVDVKEVLAEDSAAVAVAAANAAKRFVIVDGIVHHSLHRPCWTILDSRPDVYCHWRPYSLGNHIEPHRLNEATALSASFYEVPTLDVVVRGSIEVIEPDLIPAIRLDEYVGDLRTLPAVRRYLSWIPRPMALAWLNWEEQRDEFLRRPDDTELGHAVIRRYFTHLDEFDAFRSTLDERTSFCTAMKDEWSTRSTGMRKFERHFLQTIVLPPSPTNETDFDRDIAAIGP